MLTSSAMATSVASHCHSIKTDKTSRDRKVPYIATEAAADNQGVESHEVKVRSIWQYCCIVNSPQNCRHMQVVAVAVEGP